MRQTLWFKMRLARAGLCDDEASPRELSDPVGKLFEKAG